MMHFADRLLDACRAKGAPVCVGLDPVLDKLPAELRSLSAAEAIERFCVGVIDAVAEAVPCVKPQAACFERHGGAGYDAMLRVIEHARKRGLLVIADAKRGDIGVSSAHYAQAFAVADALTVSPYLGDDALQPFIDAAAAHGSGLFALVRTSNPGSDALQTLQLTDGRSVADAVADMLVRLGEPHVGASGYSLVGAVVGATKPQDAVHLRRRMPRQIFLVPGFGAQGGTADDVRACFNDDGAGAIVTASRSVIYAYANAPSSPWPDAVTRAAVDLRNQIAAIIH
jgi:orotidine-5'-phosphate decarboxylase